MKETSWNLDERRIAVGLAVLLSLGLMIQNCQAADERGRGRVSRGGRGVLQPKDTISGLVPLTEMTEPYQGEDGGLYGGEKNEPPKAHKAAAEKATAAIQPLDVNGKPSPDGKIVLLSIGMSNCMRKFEALQNLAQKTPQKAGNLVLVNGAQASVTANTWARGPASPSRKGTRYSNPWKVVDRRLSQARVTAKQVQVIWVLHANVGSGEAFGMYAKRLQEDIRKTIITAKTLYPHLRIAYLSSRTYGGYATTTLNPEPYAHVSAFSVRWVIQDQIKGDAGLNHDPKKGAVKAPLLLWGPYLWANGLTPRKSDGLTYSIDDYRPRDGTHPSKKGYEKIGGLILRFFKTDPLTKKWFLGSQPTSLPVAGKAAPTHSALKVFSGSPRLIVVNGYSTSRHWPSMLQRKLDKQFGGKRVLEVKRAIRGGSPIASWIDIKTAQPLEPWVKTLRPAIQSKADRPAIVLCQQSLQRAFGPQRQGIESKQDTERIEKGADILEKYVRLLHKDGADLVFVAMHIYKKPMEPEIGNERLAMAELAKRQVPNFHPGPDVWTPTSKLWPGAFAPDKVHPNSIGAEIMAHLWFAALLKHDGLTVPDWSRKEMEKAIKEPPVPRSRRTNSNSK